MTLNQRVPGGNSHVTLRFIIVLKFVTKSDRNIYTCGKLELIV